MALSPFIFLCFGELSNHKTTPVCGGHFLFNKVQYLFLLTLNNNYKDNTISYASK